MNRCTSLVCVGEALKRRDVIDIFFDTTSPGVEVGTQASTSSPRTITGTVAVLPEPQPTRGPLLRSSPR